MCVRVGGDLVERPTQIGCLEDRVAGRAPPFDGDVVRRRPGRDMDGDGLARWVAARAAVPLDAVEEGDVVDHGPVTLDAPRELAARSRSRNQIPASFRVCYSLHMRLHIALDDELVAELDRRAGTRQRSALIAELIRRGLDDERRWDDIEASLGGLDDQGHDWDDDPAAWVRSQRRGDSRRAG